METVWNTPPHEAKLGAYWWWLNGNVTREAITGDLEAMKEKGFGGAVIFDADGASQDGNDPVPAGPTFGTPEWRELYRHALREAARLGLTLSLNIQSGWNIGGPAVAPEDAAKIITWSETTVKGPRAFSEKLPQPKTHVFYQDSHVVAWQPRSQADAPTITASSRQIAHPASSAADQNPNSAWASAGRTVDDGPSESRPEWLQYEFSQPIKLNEVRITPRPGFGPRVGGIQVSEDGRNFRKATDFQGKREGMLRIHFSATTAKFVRLSVTAAFDPAAQGGRSRNVQIAEFSIWNDGVEISGRSRTIRDLADKILASVIRGSAPDLKYLLTDGPSQPGEETTRAADVIDLTSKLSADGTLRWTVPAGEWKILRLGATIGPRAKVSTSSAGWKGHALDVLDHGAFKRYWDAVVTPLIDDAGPLAGSALKYLHTDSWEIEPINWTPTLPNEFKTRRGYDMLPWIPVLAGQIVESRDASTRFLNDFRRTLGDLAIDNHYKPFREWSHARGLQIHPESGGPHVVPIDAQQCLGLSDVPMSEFWAESWKHRVGDPNRFFVKQPASAAHTNGRNLVMAEGFTTVGPHWQERIWNNLKPSFDKACTEGLNLLVWHAWVCSPESTGIPGQQYFAGTHLNHKVTWWSRSKPFFDYINRCQALLQRGLPVSDVLYYYGSHVPNYTQLRDHDPAGVGRGYDYDVISEDVLLSRVSVKDGRLVLPEGTSYRMLMLPAHATIPPQVLRKVRELVAAGASVAGPKPSAIQGDFEVKQLGEELWSAMAPQRVGDVKTARQALAALKLVEDFSFTGGDGKTTVSYIHRLDQGADIYFVASRGERPESLECRFRVSGKIPELWDPVSGERRLAHGYREENGTTTLPIPFNPCGSIFVIFRNATSASSLEKSNPLPWVDARELSGPWTVNFDPEWGGPASVVFDSLVSWTQRPEPGIKHYSGTATYRKTFDFPEGTHDAATRFQLDLGAMAELAEVRLNGKPLGVVWTPPFRVEITAALKAVGNQLEIDVVNFWPNRIIGDASLPEAKRLTKTNIRKLTADTELMKSGLLGPVRILKTP